ncbi:carbohydrate ABC transporter permease [Bacillus sp. F19]|nr:carbohydrate ABC transporter permease [Bacillus sp. F19]
MSVYYWGKKVLNILLLLLLLVIYLFPFYWMITTSLKSELEAMGFPPSFFPTEIHLENYMTAWTHTNLFHYLKNSIIVTVLTVIGQLLICVPAAYAFAKKKFKLSKVFFGLILFDLMVPIQVTFLPNYILLTNIGWIDTYKALIVPSLYSSFAIFFMTQTFKQIPDEILDAAKLDKTSEMKMITQIMLPMAKPIIITVALFTFISKWNDYFWTLIVTNSDAVRTLPIAMKSLLGAGDGLIQWNIVMAGNVILVAPLIILYVIANKQIKQAFVYGGIK